MDKSKRSAGYPRLKEAIILTQTDTTVGFLSQNAKKLTAVKERSPKKPFLKNFLDFKTLKTQLRVPNNRKRTIRRAKKTTFIVKNQAFRVAQPQTHSVVLRKLKWFYSTSANKSAEKFRYDYAFSKADIVIKNPVGLYETTPSRLVQCNKKKMRRLR